MTIEQAIERLQMYKDQQKVIAIDWFDQEDIINKAYNDHQGTELSRDELEQVANLMEENDPNEGMNWWTMDSAIEQVLDKRN